VIRRADHADRPGSGLVIHSVNSRTCCAGDGQKESGRDAKKHRHQFVRVATSRVLMGTVAEALFEQMWLFALNTASTRAIPPPIGAYGTNGYLKVALPVALHGGAAHGSMRQHDKVAALYRQTVRRWASEVMPPDPQCLPASTSPQAVSAILFGLSGGAQTSAIWCDPQLL